MAPKPDRFALIIATPSETAFCRRRGALGGLLGVRSSPSESCPRRESSEARGAATGANAGIGDSVALHFSVATPSGQQHYRTRAKIARILDDGNGLGVSFSQGIENEAFDALMGFGPLTSHRFVMWHLIFDKSEQLRTKSSHFRGGLKEPAKNVQCNTVRNDGHVFRIQVELFDQFLFRPL